MRMEAVILLIPDAHIWLDHATLLHAVLCFDGDIDDGSRLARQPCMYVGPAGQGACFGTASRPSRHVVGSESRDFSVQA
jgi:hypothetical protein